VLGGREFRRVLLTAALTAVDYCEGHEDEAFAVNGIAPRVVAGICRDKGAHLTYFSTDMVFDGLREGLYTEEDVARPLSVYGASKLAGEEAVLGVSAANLVVRVSWLYGPGRPAFPEWIIGRAREASEVVLPADKVGSPTFSIDVAGLLEPLLAPTGGTVASGIVHLCNTGVCTWQEWGQFCIDTAREAGVPLKATRVGANSLADIPTFVARRPANSAMDTAKYTRLTGVTPRDWRTAQREHLSQEGSVLHQRTPARA
jgi:dTDP-4-dehydrorhamnose reductase